MINMMNNIKMPLIFDPKTLNDRMKKSLVNHTISYSKIGPYKDVPKYKPIVFQFIQNFDAGIPNNICNVKIINEHILDVAEMYAEKGINFSTGNNMNPVILNIVGREFSGSNLENCEEMRDHLINLRTTFNNSLGVDNYFPVKEEESVYMKLIMIIRPKNVSGFLNFTQCFRTSMITTSPIITTKLLPDNRMYIEDYIKTCTVIESVFQLAICKNHKVLILPPFGHEDDNNPVDDIIKIYNYCILKYGHYFNEIVIGVPKYYPKTVFQNYEKNIIKPQIIVSEIDKLYEKEELKNKLMSKSLNNVNLKHKDDDDDNDNGKINDEKDDVEEFEEKPKKKEQFTDDQMKMMMTFMQSMMKSQ
jgi:hypothetical protein